MMMMMIAKLIKLIVMIMVIVMMIVMIMMKMVVVIVTIKHKRFCGFFIFPGSAHCINFQQVLPMAMMVMMTMMMIFEKNFMTIMNIHMYHNAPDLDCGDVLLNHCINAIDLTS